MGTDFVQNCKDYFFPWMKLCHKKTIVIPSRFHSGMIYGLSIDIFPMDCTKATDKESAIEEAQKINQFYKSEMKKYLPLSTLRTGRINAIKRKVKKVRFKYMEMIRGSIKKTVFETIEEELKGNNLLPNNYTFLPFEKTFSIHPSEIFTNEPSAISFHGREFFAPYKYKEVQMAYYGSDYMTPPPKEERVTRHIAEVYYK